MGEGKKLLVIAALLFLSVSIFSQSTELPFTKGVNLLDYFTTWDHQKDKLPDMYRYDEADFACMKTMGIDVIRLAICFDYQMEPEDTGKIKEALLQKLDEVCDWSEKYQIYLIIDNHSFGTRWDTTKPKAPEEHLTSLWSQIAPRYKDRSDYIIYEIQNEPGFRTGTDWNKIQQRMIDLIRKYDTKHAIIVSPQNYSDLDDLVKLKPYKDSNLIYTFHFYEPMLFTHHGATWIGEGFAKTDGIPFPYDKSRMPKLRKSASNNSWLLDMYNNYYQIGTVKYLNARIKKAADWAKKNNVRLFVGEIGSNLTTNLSDRTAWNQVVTNALKEYNIPYCVWGLDYGCGFLDFSSTGKEEGGYYFPDDINKAVVESYGFSMPSEDAVAKTSLNSFPQKPYIVYDGIGGKFASFNPPFGNVKTVNESDSHGYCMKATYSGKGQCGGIVFFPPKKIISNFIANRDSLCISFSVKFTDENQIIELHLVDTDEGAELPPWQNTYTVKASDYKTGEWVTVQIPVSDFAETGAWSNKASKWFNPQGKFDWNRFDCIYFDFWHETNQKGDIYIDDVVIKRK